MAIINNGDSGLSARTKINQAINRFGIASGTNTYTVTLNPAITAYEAGQSYDVFISNANTGASTINFNSVGALTLKSAGGAALVSGDIVANTYYTITIIDGSNAQIDVCHGETGTWTPTFTGFSVVPSNVTARYYRIPGTKVVFCHLQVDTPGTSNATSMTVTLPFPAANTTTQKWEMQGFNNTAAVSPPAMMRTQVNSNICDCFLTTANGAWLNSGTKAINGNFCYETT